MSKLINKCIMDNSDIKEHLTEGIEFGYIETPPNSWTFNSRKIREVVEFHLEGRVLNLFAGKTKLDHDDEVVRNDLDTERDADYHFDAMKVGEYFDENSFDTVVLDPPYNARKSREKYNGEYKGKLTHAKDQLKNIVKPGGVVITFGYATTGMSKSRGFELEHVYVINHKGDHNDTLFTVERKKEE